MGKTGVLLGAGASVDAGIPASVSMTKRIAEAVEPAWGRTTTARALHYAIGAMIAHDTAGGQRAYDGIDVERLFAAVQMLRDRDTLEVAPFVAAWAPALDGLGAQSGFPAFFAEDFQRALTSPFRTDIERIFRRAIESVKGTSDWPATFRKLETEMIEALTQMCEVDGSRTKYLAPLLTLETPVEIATLNYDRSVEELVASAGLSCDTGITHWAGGADWDWDESADVRLLKLHGSIDWEIRQSDGVLSEPTVTPRGQGGDERRGRGSPAVVFGQRGKLRPDGPFLPMLLEFEQMLVRCKKLLVVGYSFRDSHINAAIRKWLNASVDHEITLVDPSPETDDYGSFLAQLQTALIPGRHGGKKGEAARLHLVREGAAAGLFQVLGSGPSLASSPEESAGGAAL